MVLNGDESGTERKDASHDEHLIVEIIKCVASKLTIA